MANSISHKLPYPIKNAKFTVEVEFRATADGTLATPSSPSTLYSQDGTYPSNACANSVTGTSGNDLFTFTGAETNSRSVLLAITSSNCFTVEVDLTPLNLPILSSGTLSAGSSGGGTLGTVLAYDISGCFIRTTGGTGGGGTGGANNQARRILTYNTSTGAFTCDTWETTPSTDTTYDILIPEGSVACDVLAYSYIGTVYTYLTTNLGLLGANLSAIPKTGFKLASDGLSAISAWTVALTGNITGNLSGSVGSVTGNVGGNVTGSVGSVSGAVGSVTGAVGSVTGNVGGNVVGSVGSVTVVSDKTGYALTSAYDAAKTAASQTALSTLTTTLGTPAGASIAADIAANLAKWTTAITESYAAKNAAPTPEQAMMMILQSIHEFAISGTERTVNKLDGSTTAMVFTMDSATAPTSTTRST